MQSCSSGKSIEAKARASALIILPLCLLIGLVPTRTQATGGILPGEGTATSPYLVSDYADLSTITLGKYSDTAVYRLVADIDASPSDTANADSGFRPIGLRGSFHGGGHVIRNLSIHHSPSTCGLFAALDVRAVLDSLGLEGGSIVSGGDSPKGETWVGGLVASNEGSIVDCHATISVVGDTSSGWVGGLVGCNRGQIRSSWSSGSVTGDTFSAVGGLVGGNLEGSIVSCHASGNVASKGQYSGGLVGVTGSKGRIDSCWASGSVTSTNKYAYLGGLVGEGHGSIRNSHATGAVTFATGGGSPRVGGLVGSGGVGDTLEDCYATGSVDALDMAGGLFGTSFGEVIRRCYATGSVTVSDNYAVAGGLGGEVYHTKVVDCYATGSVTGPANTYLGGLVAWNTGIVDTCYSTGKVAGGPTMEIGALVGNNDSLIFRSYWNTETAGQGKGFGTDVYGDTGRGLSSAQMKLASSFVGWDFENTWILESGDAAPRLRSLAMSYVPASIEATAHRASAPYAWTLEGRRLTISVPGRIFQAVVCDPSGRILARISGTGAASLDRPSSRILFVKVWSSHLQETFCLPSMR